MNMYDSVTNSSSTASPFSQRGGGGGGGGGGSNGMRGGGFYLSTASFISDIIKYSHKPAPIAGQQYIATRAVELDRDEIFCNNLVAHERLNFVESNDLLVDALNHIMTQVLASGVSLVIKDSSGKTLELSEQQIARFNIHMPMVATRLFIHQFAFGYAAIKIVHDALDRSVLLAEVKEPLDYTMSFSQKTDEVRLYTVYAEDHSTKLRKAYLLLSDPPNKWGVPRSLLTSLIRRLQQRDGMHDDQYYAQYWRTHPLYISQPTSSASTSARSEILNAPVYAADDVEAEIHAQRDIVTITHKTEMDQNIVDVKGATREAALTAREKNRQLTGYVGFSHPTVEAALEPPHQKIFNLGLDRQMTTGPVPQLYPNIEAYDNMISRIVYDILSLTITPGGTNFNTVAEASINTRMYNISIAKIQQQLSSHLSSIWRNIGKTELKNILKGRFDTDNPESNDNFINKIRKTARKQFVKEQWRDINVQMIFNAVPHLDAAQIIMLYDNYVIDENTKVRYLAATGPLPKEDILDTQQVRDKERKRRLDQQIDEAERMALGTQSSLSSLPQQSNASSSGDDQRKRQKLQPSPLKASISV